MVAVGFEPTKHNAGDLKSPPFDQLGHVSIWLKVLLAGFEPAIPGLEVRCVIHCATGACSALRFILYK